MFDSPALEEHPFAVVAEQDSIQSRDYEAHMVAETEVDETCHTATEIAFNGLSNYISGINAGSSKIEMTAPVPVILQERNISNSPAPVDSQITLVDMSARKITTSRFTVRLQTTAIEAHRSELAT